MLDKNELVKAGLDHLENKQVGMIDIIRIISNKNIKSNVPNFSLLLGAGASVTSGIRSGQQLIDVWKKELHPCGGDGPDANSWDEYISRPENKNWYNPNAEYASLFERMYSLQKQRRQFVENEVQDKNPSIGYAYLVNLMGNNVFNTVFTTNFDDLISEAFYSFSSERPIVCAHDSSISSISVTSSHPKIIKLHGDYLFDNIKATLRETESLEHNMRMKFQEFAKDFGMIVIGYSGNDRSVMDILSYLLTKDEYFKNGIYWCIRKGDTPCSELRNLLSKDRVFYLEIDGFDEFMAELNSKLNGGRLPINEGFLSYQHQDSLIKSLIDNQYIQSSTSHVLKEDCDNLKKQVKDNKLNDFLKFSREQKEKDLRTRKARRYTERKCPFGDMTQDQKARIDKISFEAFALGHSAKALNLIKEEDYFNLEPSTYKIELMKLYVDINSSMDDSEIKQCFDALIDLDPENFKHYLVAANRSNNPKQEIEFLLRAEKRFGHSRSVKNRISSAILSYYEAYLDRQSYDADLKKVEAVIRESLALDPSLDNDAWVLKARWLLIKYDNDRDRLKAEAETLINECRKINPVHVTTVEIVEQLCKKEYDEKLLTDALSFYKSSTGVDNIEDITVRLILLYEKNEGIEKAIQFAKVFEKDYEPSQYYLLSKAKLFIKHEFFSDAIALLKNFDSSERVTTLRMEAYNYLGDEDSLESLFREKAGSSIESDSFYYSYKDDYKAIVSLYEKKVQSGGLLSTEELISYSYALLQTKDYLGCVKLLKEYYQSPVILSKELYVNYLFAANNLDSKDPEKIDNNTLQLKVTERIIKSPEKSDAVLVAAYALLGDQVKCFEYISKAVRKDPTLKYEIRKWPIVSKYAKNAKFLELVKPEIKTIES